LFFPTKTAHTAPPADAVDIDIEVAPGVTIGCRLFTADKEAPTILFFHGNGEILQDYDDIAPHYLERKINFLVTEYRGYGWSGGSPSFSTLLSDAHVVYRGLKKYLTDNGYSPALFLMGRSLGSAPAIELASSLDQEIKGLIIESGFAETLPLAESLGITIEGVEISEEQTFNNIGKIATVTIPTFILHGQNDTLIPLWQAQKLHAECGARSKELQVVPGADHNTLIAVGGMYYFQAIQQFVDRVSGTSDWRRRRKQFKEQP
jgi:alpha-beta hydrolase superfamily lysophospholipase